MTIDEYLNNKRYKPSDLITIADARKAIKAILDSSYIEALEDLADYVEQKIPWIEEERQRDYVITIIKNHIKNVKSEKQFKEYIPEDL